MKPYQSADSDIPVTVSCGNNVASAVVTAEQVYTFVLNCEANENQQVTITGGDGSNTKRVVVTQVDIYSSTSNAKMRFTLPNRDEETRVFTDITSKFYNVTGLTEFGTYSYRVKAYYVNGTSSAWSNVEEVTLFDNGPAPHGYTPGDVNHDEVVDINDVTDLIDHLLGISEVCTICADVDEDNEVSINDVTRLIDILLGIY